MILHDFDPVLIDFGFISDKNEKNKGFKGSPPYYSPQMYQAYKKYRNTNGSKSHNFEFIE